MMQKHFDKMNTILYLGEMKISDIIFYNVGFIDMMPTPYDIDDEKQFLPQISGILFSDKELAMKEFEDKAMKLQKINDERIEGDFRKWNIE